MLPIDVNRESRGGAGKGSRISEHNFPKYFRRLIDFKQMDFEVTFDQLIMLLSTEPDDV